MTQMTTTKAGPNLGARVEGLDLRAMTPEEVRDLLVPLLHEFHVLVIPGEVLEADELEQFARAWGDLLEHPASVRRRRMFRSSSPKARATIGSASGIPT